MFKDDFYRNTGVEWKFNIKNLFMLLYSHQIRYLYWVRRAHKNTTFLNQYKIYRFSRKYGLEISCKADIGNGLYLGHPYNITVSAGTVLGRNCNLHKGCTVGRENRGDRAGSPRIGDRVYIGINSTVVGDIEIGDDVLIGANTFVNFDVPQHSVVVGNPASIHYKENATEGYIINIV